MLLPNNRIQYNIYNIIFFCKVDIIFFCISYLEKFKKYIDFLRVNMQENMRYKVGYVIRRKTIDVMHILNKDQAIYTTTGAYCI